MPGYPRGLWPESMPILATCRRQLPIFLPCLLQTIIYAVAVCRMVNLVVALVIYNVFARNFIYWDKETRRSALFTSASSFESALHPSFSFTVVHLQFFLHLHFVFCRPSPPFAVKSRDCTQIGNSCCVTFCRKPRLRTAPSRFVAA